jgi:hypothetical protein
MQVGLELTLMKHLSGSILGAGHSWPYSLLLDHDEKACLKSFSLFHLSISSKEKEY